MPILDESKLHNLPGVASKPYGEVRRELNRATLKAYVIK